MLSVRPVRELERARRWREVGSVIEQNRSPRKASARSPSWENDALP